MNRYGLAAIAIYLTYTMVVVAAATTAATPSVDMVQSAYEIVGDATVDFEAGTTSLVDLSALAEKIGVAVNREVRVPADRKEEKIYLILPQGRIAVADLMQLLAAATGLRWNVEGNSLLLTDDGVSQRQRAIDQAIALGMKYYRAALTYVNQSFPEDFGPFARREYLVRWQKWSRLNPEDRKHILAAVREKRMYGDAEALRRTLTAEEPDDLVLVQFALLTTITVEVDGGRRSWVLVLNPPRVELTPIAGGAPADPSADRWGSEVHP